MYANFCLLCWGKVAHIYEMRALSRSKLISPTHPVLSLSHPTPHTFTWNTIIKSHPTLHPLSLYTRMRRHDVAPDLYTFPFLLSSIPDSSPCPSHLHAHILLSGFLAHPFTQTSLISAYAGLHPYSLPAARQLFDEIPHPDLPSYNSVLSAYLRAGLLSDARELFDSMPDRNVLTWTCMIHGHVESGDYKAALRLFRGMQQLSTVRPNHFTVSSVLAACARSGALEQGKWVHTYIERCGIAVDAVVGTALIDMYCKCGCIERAVQVFDGLGPKKDVMAWSAMVAGLALHGHAAECLALFQKMCESKVVPNAVTFLGVLCACAHAGLVRKAESYFDRMSSEFGIAPTIQHYGCMVDLYARAGLITKAWDAVTSMPMEPDVLIWGALLSGSRTHSDIATCEASIKQLIELNPANNSAYVLLSNVYAKLGRWDDVRAARRTMKDMGIKKTPGCSAVEIDGQLHEFFSGDDSHPESRGTYHMLDEITERLKQAGYVVRTEEVLLDLDEGEKEHALAVHSEKLAVAFSFMKTRPGTAVRIIKNLRICGDCHEAMKLISKVYGREIVVRDCRRFHHFRDGICSCKDYW